VNSNVPRNYSNLASEQHRNYLFKFKLVLSSVRSNTHMMAPRCANRLQTCSVSTPAANMVKLYGFNPLWTMITTMFQEKSNMYHISEPIIRSFFPKLVRLCSLLSSFHWLIQLCNETLQHFARFWRLFHSVMWSTLVPFLSVLLISFLVYFVLSWFF